MSSTEHRIGRLVFDLAAPDEAALCGLNALLRNRFESVILPALQAALDRIDLPGELIRVDRLEINLGVFDPATLDSDELGRRMFDSLGVALATLLQAPDDSSERDDTAELLAFLETGELPWTEPGKALDALSANLLALNAAAMRRLAERLRPLLIRRSAVERLLRQLPAALVRRLLRALLPDALALPLRVAFGNDSPAPASPMTAVPETLLAALGGMIRNLATGLHMPEPAEVISLYAALDSRTVLPGALLPPTAPALVATPRTEPVEAAGQAVQSTPRPVHAAGAVLLHPFLGTFFDRLGLLAGSGSFRDRDAQGRAVLLAHHLATGAEEAPEPETPLFKLLCGLPFSEPLPRRIELDEREREESDTLLRGVIGHWQRLGNTSPAGLREGFLTRPGRLERRGESWLLSVESRGIDVLLQGLPWTLSHVRTPFMQSILRVDWR